MEIIVNLSSRSYSIILEHNVSDSIPELLKKQFPKSRFAMVTNTTIASLYSSMLKSWKQRIGIEIYEIPDGEQYKTIDTWKNILDFLLQSKFERSSVIIALGGGVVGDITGFAASAFLRGISFVQIPTTLLAMVDSSVGGKTAVDHPLGKNLIGAFHQPKGVFIDTRFISTLPDREFTCGYAELFKAAFVGGRKLFDFVNDKNDKMLSKDHETLIEGIRKSVQMKAHIVEDDECETKDLRALLNFGHTFAHSLERFFNFTGVLHGEAVFWGIKCAYELGKQIGTVKPDDYQLYDSLISKMPLPKLPSKPDPEKLYSMMFTDKKVESGKIRFVVPTEPGTSIVKNDIPAEDVKAVLMKIFGEV